VGAAGEVPAPLAVVHGERVVLRPAQPDDAPALAHILAEPEVARWWGANDADDVGEALGEQPSWVILVDGAVAGWLHVHEETDPAYRHVAFDIAVTTALRGGGYGREALELAVRHFAEAGHHRFTIDPSGPTRPWDSGPSGSCGRPSAPPTAPGATAS
jgi:aminoglycoside 6'-N-acetyltransferase